MKKSITEEAKSIAALLIHDDWEFFRQGLFLWEAVADSYEEFVAFFENITDTTWCETSIGYIPLRDALSSLIQGGKKLVYVSYWCLAKLAEFPELDQYFRSITYLELPSPSIKKSGYFRLYRSLFGRSRKDMYEFPDNLCNLRYVQKISYSNGELREFPDWLQGFTQLRVLDLSHNLITEVPSWIYELQELQVLKLSRNNIRELPETFGHLRKLEVLDISNNPLTMLPDSIECIEGILTLNLHKTRLETFPGSLRKLKKLQQLDLSAMGLISIIEDWELPNLEILNLADNNLAELPTSLWHSIHLKRLDLSSNRLVELSDDIMNLTQLEELNVHSNKLRKLPDSLFELPFVILDPNQHRRRLTSFLGKKSTSSKRVSGLLRMQNGIIACIFSDNPLEYLPSSMMQFHEIEALRLTFPLKKLPEGFARLHRLNHLNLNGCKLEKFPQELLALENLQILHLRGNGITKIPEEIYVLQQLKVLNLVENRLYKLPQSIRKLSRLKTLHLQGNRIPSGDIEILQKDLLNTGISF